ncbi:MAG: DUF6273 domain-containing protein [Eggerthellaceae bacterium]|jgi:hypothetical protein|nr:DUF6273 domain-containing protein [Eggerthellaceae bacterium]MDR2715242.1 DUF6273 domain-containing protein [Coriobacteriaceae bacterium]
MDRRRFLRLGAAVGVSLASSAAFSALLTGCEQNPPLDRAQAGDVVRLGNVAFPEYFGGELSRNIGWRVLAAESGRVLVISEKIIDLRPYNDGYARVTWETCTLRKWLNVDFFEYLPEAMRDAVMAVKLENLGNPDVRSEDSNETVDRVFLLSGDEAKDYLPTYDDRRASLDVSKEAIEGYVENQGEDIKALVEKHGGGAWWLRSSGSSESSAAYIFNNGRVMPYGSIIIAPLGVRPALWLRTSE